MLYGGTTAAERRERLRIGRPARPTRSPASPYAFANVRPTTTFGVTRRGSCCRSAFRRRNRRRPRRRTRARRARRPRCVAIAPRGIIWPVGLFGFVRKTTRVRGVIAASTRSSGNAKSASSGNLDDAAAGGVASRPHTCRRPGRHDRLERRRGSARRAAPQRRLRGCPRRGRWSAAADSGPTPRRRAHASMRRRSRGRSRHRAGVSACSASITRGEQPAVFSFRCSRSPSPASARVRIRSSPCVPRRVSRHLDRGSVRR